MLRKWINKSVLQKWGGTIRSTLANMTDEELHEASECLDELYRMVEREQTTRFQAVH